MSTVTTLPSIGAVVIVALFCINAIVYRVRYGTFLRRREGERSALRRKLGTVDVISAMFLCLALLVAMAAPVFAPASAFAAWLHDSYSWFVYAAWCWLFASGISIGPKVIELLRRKSDV